MKNLEPIQHVEGGLMEEKDEFAQPGFMNDQFSVHSNVPVDAALMSMQSGIYFADPSFVDK